MKYMVSPKDDELFFGLYDAESAQREYLISQYLVGQKVRVTEVVGYADIRHVFSVEPFFNNGRAVDPCILYTKVRSVYRVADLAYLSPRQINQSISDVCHMEGWSPAHFLEAFCYELTKTVGMMHKLGCCNDTLDPNNVTLAAEITDFEWITTPACSLPVAPYYPDIEKRRAKEIVYLFEVCFQLSCYMGKVNRISEITAIIKKTYISLIPEKRDFLAQLFDTAEPVVYSD